MKVTIEKTGNGAEPCLLQDAPRGVWMVQASGRNPNTLRMRISGQRYITVVSNTVQTYNFDEAVAIKGVKFVPSPKQSVTIIGGE